MKEDISEEASAMLALAVSVEMANGDELSDMQARALVERNYLWARGVVDRYPVEKRDGGDHER